MAEVEGDQSEKTYFNPTWIAHNGSFVHSNNVLFYFATSPFFDRSSGNSSLEAQCKGDPEKELRVLSTRARFEANLRMLSGVQYIVLHDPLESRIFVDGPNGSEQSNVWVIRKQDRLRPGEDKLSILGYYYISNDVIYQAPSLGGVLVYRMLNTVTSLNKLFSASAKFPYFSASHGHTYFKPIQKQPMETTSGISQQSKEATPAPDSQRATVEPGTKATTHGQTSTESNSKVLQEALQMTLRYGKEYMDEVPLVGEPGNFRFSKAKIPTAPAAISTAPSLPQNASRSSTPSHSRADSTGTAAPQVSAPSPRTTPSKLSKPAEKDSTAVDVSTKLKRRKSRAAETNS